MNKLESAQFFLYSRCRTGQREEKGAIPKEASSNTSLEPELKVNISSVEKK